MAEPFTVVLPDVPIEVGQPGHAEIETAQVEAIEEVRTRLGVAEDDIDALPAFTAVGTSVATAATVAAARTAIGAGTSSLGLGTTASTALAGNTALLALGTTASTALAGNTAFVPPTRTVAGKALSANITLALADVGIPAPAASGTFVLTATDGVLSWEAQV